MAAAIQDDSTLFRAYRRELVALEMPECARLGSVLAFLINTAFILLDYVSFPDRFQSFLTMRLGLNALFVVTNFTSARYPRVSTWSICLSLGAVMLSMIFATGGTMSPYFGGLMLLFLAMGVVLPLSGIEAACLCGIILLPYLVSPWIDSTPVDWATSRIYSLFLLSAAAESVASCAYLERMRFKDFKQRLELKEARDHLEEVDRAKSRFTANIHHELRTPLTLTLAPIEGMLSGEFGEISDQQRQYMKTAENNALRLLKLINNLLDLAKLESHELNLNRVSLATPPLVRGLVENVRPLAERKGIQLLLDCDDDVPIIQADPEALEKIIINLLGNALKFTESGGTIALELEADRTKGGLLLRVVDSGIGIAPAELERIFDRFAQVDSSGTRKHEGTGIGLSLCQELVELHGGLVWAESEGQGHGTKICVWLPAGDYPCDEDAVAELSQDGAKSASTHSIAALEAEANIDHETTEPNRVAKSSGDRTCAGIEQAISRVAPEFAPEIVVAEDNPEMRQLLQHLLSKEFRVRVASNGREALDLVRQRQPALVLTDVMMPEMTGLELCRELKSSPETRGVPVILVTSKAERSMKVEGLELGADDYVTKPFHARELLARVRSSVWLHIAQVELEESHVRLQQANLRTETALTELKDTQVQLVQRERLVGLGELAAGVAHEANNPLNFAANANRALIGCLDDVEDVVQEIISLGSVGTTDANALLSLEKVRRLCSERDFEESSALLRELSGIIEEGLERTTRLVGDLRAFAGSHAERHETLDVLAGLKSTLKLVSHSMRESSIEAEIQAEPDLPLLVGDPRSLNQVFLNLFKNSQDAMSERGGTIRVTLSGEEDALVICIHDEGHGIPDSVRQTLFEPFRTTKGPGDGSGLGLSVSRNIVFGLGGTLTVLETSPLGTTFEIRLPLPDDK